MSDSYDCPHGMGKATSCLTCMEDGPVAPPKKQVRLEASYFMAAQYDSSCPSCGGRIHAGEEIGSTEIGWCCDSCCRRTS